eukprot:4989255-Prymnesium_polylepis.1
MYAVLYASMNCCATIERLQVGARLLDDGAVGRRRARFGGAAAIRTAPMLAKHSAVCRRMKSSIILSLMQSLTGSMQSSGDQQIQCIWIQQRYSSSVLIQYSRYSRI